ncbi:energy transducer TonB [Gloeobacter kilaueensis]|uniref:TonB family protein n=1 Tax=Gloeobacter kilaueensis (strain ATCC BAA-2537 / CCAP 1431/1 / ULC 316 / JS1) TaxID=1183438 RepID=U5QCM9_GLOK1|nr:energy transducer TonB [Gloeobacter kilaueensis]AGY56677.1 hypothetical protein GKIL_0431 [Gloeobacter kilaueensis JS1]
MARFIPLCALMLTLAGTAALPLLAQQDSKTAPSAELRAYQLKVRDKILENWQPPDIDNDTRLEVSVRVDRDGKVTTKPEVKVLDGASKSDAEDAVLDAVRRSQPFESVPANVAPFYVDVRFRLKIAARTPATPKCFPVATYIDLPAERQAPVKKGIDDFTGLLRDTVGNKPLFNLVSDRSQADLIVQASSDPRLPRIEKARFAGRYTVNDALSTGTIDLGLKDSSGKDYTDGELTLNTMQLLGRVLGLAGTGGQADSIMSDVRIAPRFAGDQARYAADTVKAASCTAQNAQRGFQVVTATAPEKK